MGGPSSASARPSPRQQPPLRLGVAPFDPPAQVVLRVNQQRRRVGIDVLQVAVAEFADGGDLLRVVLDARLGLALGRRGTGAWSARSMYRMSLPVMTSSPRPGALRQGTSTAPRWPIRWQRLK